MSTENSVPDKEIRKATPKESDNATPHSLEEIYTDFEGNERSTDELSQTQQMDSESDAALTSRDVLYTQACKEMSNYAKYYTSVALQNKMLELQSVLAQIENIDLKADFVCDDDVYAIVRDIGKVEDDYVAMRTNVQYKSDTDLIQQILTEVGFEAQEQKLTEARRLLVKNFANALDKFNATISDTERTTEWELVEFYERFKAASDFQEQFNYFDEFWAIFW